jgi:hypothetical protein
MRDRIELRGRDAVAQCLIRRLTVPRIYFEARWPLADSAVDVLAIDRDGVGDAHVVEIKRTAADALRDAARLIARITAPFRWIAFVRGTEDEESARAILNEEGLIDPRRPGRVGVIEIVEMGADLGANVQSRAERFSDAVYDVATAFSGSHKANIQFGG